MIGPLVFWSLMYIVGAVIKLLAYNDTDVYFEIGPEASLWAVGIVFALTVSEHTYFGVRAHPQITKKPSGRGLEIDYDVTIPDEVGFTPNFIYLFLFSVVIWIINLLLSGCAIESYSSAQQLTAGAIVATSLSILLASTLVVIAVRTLYEVLK